LIDSTVTKILLAIEVQKLTQKLNFQLACLSNCRYCVDCAQNLPGPAQNNVLSRVLQISSISVHYFGGVTTERVNTAKSPRKVNPIISQSPASS